MEEKSKESNVYVSSINMSHINKDYYWEVSLTLELKASYGNFIKFIKLLEERKVAIENIILSTEKIVNPGNEEGDLTIRLTITGIVIK